MVPISTSIAPEPEWLSRWRNAQLNGEQGLLLFDGLDAVQPDAVTGRWRGSSLHTGHPLDGLLELFGWYGKAFDTPEIVHPLLFRGPKGDIFPVNPALLPINWILRRPELARNGITRRMFVSSRHLLRARGPVARLRAIEHRGITSAAIVYDRQPIIDYFRRIDDDRILGIMDLRSMSQPFFFLLLRD
jgi:hypothetical protein